MNRMADPAICATKLSKVYRLGVISRHTLQDEWQYWWHRMRRRNPAHFMGRLGRSPASPGPASGDVPRADDFWALKEVSFTVARGEIVGIIGRNGAGKTTLLKILSRITEPTSGEAVIDGRVGSLLEVGTGFHPELTGRENVYLNGTILGMRKREIDAKFDEIVAFSEIEKFIDTPVKRYSSGMFVRLAFAVAAHLEPEILMVDEVLAVGDAAFQRKCLGKMNDVAGHGRTILFVSHNMAAVQTLCTRAIWIDEGRVRAEGAAEDIVSQYLHTTASCVTDRLWGPSDPTAANEHVRLERVRVAPRADLDAERITTQDPFDIEVFFENRKPDAHLHVNVTLYNESSICVFVATTRDDPAWRNRPFPAGRFRSVCRVPANLLSAGMYRVRIMLVRDASVVLCKAEDAVVFDIHEPAQPSAGWYGKYHGVVRPVLEWHTEPLSGGSGSGDG